MSHNSLVPLQVRGKVLWCEHNSRCVILDLRQGLEIEQLQRFIHEAKKDIEHLVEDLEVSDCLEDQLRPSHTHKKSKGSSQRTSRTWRRSPWRSCESILIT